MDMCGKMNIQKTCVKVIMKRACLVIERFGGVGERGRRPRQGRFVETK